MSSFFKKRQSTHGVHTTAAANVPMTEAEAALAQSDFNIDKISEIQSKFAGGAVLLVPGRIFIREGSLWKICRKGPKKRHFFLFNDILVYGSAVANRYSNQHLLPLSQMSVSAECHYEPTTQASFTFEGDHLDEQLDVAHAFQINHANKSFHVFALSAADKANWLSNLQKHIAKVSQSGGGKVSARAVWVPDSMSKSCMVCGQKFTAFVRKHHCRRCGRVICSTCSPSRVNLRSPDASLEPKMERVCKECFREMFIPRANSDSSNTQRDPSLPPTATVAAQVVSSVLQGRLNSKTTRPSGRHGDSSTDTEDSDDSENEEKEKESTTPPQETTSGTPPTRVLVVPPEEEAHPTPPPRRKRQQKLREAQQKEAEKKEEEEEKSPHNSPQLPHSQERNSSKDSLSSKDSQEVSQEQTGPQAKEEVQQRPQAEEVQQRPQAEEEVQQRPQVEVEVQQRPQVEVEVQCENSTPKKPRRRRKYIRPEEVEGGEGKGGEKEGEGEKQQQPGPGKEEETDTGPGKQGEVETDTPQTLSGTGTALDSQTFPEEIASNPTTEVAKETETVPLETVAMVTEGGHSPKMDRVDSEAGVIPQKKPRGRKQKFRTPGSENP